MVVYIPDGQDKPFVCKNGRVYRRVSDSSYPIPETDRYALDKLYEEGHKITIKHRKFCRDERNHNTDDGWVKIFLSPYPLGILNNYKIKTFTSEDLEKIFDLSKQPIEHYSFEPLSLSGNTPFNSGQTSFNSLIFRQNNSSFQFNSLKFELFKNFQAKIFVPLQYLVPWQKDIFNNLSEPIKKVLDTSHKSGMITAENIENNNLLFFDTGKLCLSILNLVNFYQYLLEQQALVEQLEITIKLENVKRHLPFFDSGEWAEYLNKFSQPINYKSTICINKANDRGLLLNCDSKLPLGICVLVGNSFGIPLDLVTNIVCESIAKYGKK